MHCLLALPFGSSGATAAEPRSVAELAAEAKPSVVVVTYLDREGEVAGLGTGFVIDKNGLIATNRHVIGEARPIRVQLSDGTDYDVSEVHATARNADLAILKIDADDLKPLPLGESSRVRPGETVVALGNPQGLKYSVVTGVLSGKRRIDEQPMLQLAMPIEPGNSGGPLLNTEGRVLGIVSIKSLVTPNLGFAIEIDALKPLIEEPNPVSMDKWLTIGRLDPKRWSPLYGANWSRRAGRIAVEGRGVGFGGRSLLIANEDPPTRPYELAVTVKLDDEAGAAGLIFGSNGGDRHFGFYPSGGGLRLSRFDGPDVFSWQVLKEVRTRHYRPGDWNRLVVRITEKGLFCSVNGHIVIESDEIPPADGKLGLAKFRDTKAEFRHFEFGKTLPSRLPNKSVIAAMREAIEPVATIDLLERSTVEKLSAAGATVDIALREEARLLEERAARLRRAASAVHAQKVLGEIKSVLSQENFDFLEVALLISKLDNPDLEVDSYLQIMDDLAADVRSDLNDPSETEILDALNRRLFSQLGYHGSRTNYYHRANSYLNAVIDDREGLPLSLSMLYIGLAQRLGVEVAGIGLPGHFIVRHEPKNGESRWIDVFEEGEVISREEAFAIARRSTRTPLDESVFTAATEREMLIRMLRNLMGIAREDEDVAGLLRYVDAVLTIDPDSSRDLFYRAVLNYQSELWEAAIDDCDRLLDSKSRDVDLARVAQLKSLVIERRDSN
ncbi:putative periplasmic serine endoprotease DegP-like precursor [Stratiformator vulcanicus]|uniref:Putative periplasmic serine endoprotease DegP-like n=2 Tax=Stratiformator vulcanicus TaxID=2527980 RepID=A0A517QYY5_9PLAN|nr:putative periplasmic serine endoprotease DegP-like precursor [Stratiformator vulcanicus]